MTNTNNAAKLGRDFIRQFRGFIELVKEIDHINDLELQKNTVKNSVDEYEQKLFDLKAELDATTLKIEEAKKYVALQEDEAGKVIKYSTDKAAEIIEGAEEVAAKTKADATAAVEQAKKELAELKHTYATEQRRLGDKTIAAQKAYDEIAVKMEELRGRLNG